MKIKKQKNIKNSLLIKLKLTEIQTKNFYSNFDNPADLVIKLKRAFKIIYKYHVNKKKIMFVGIPGNVSQKFKKLLKKSKHVFVPKFFWNYGILTNPDSSLKNFANKKLKRLNNFFLSGLKKKKKVNLVVMLRSNYKEAIANECYKIRLPIIFLSEVLNFKYRESYTLPINLRSSNEKINDSFFYTMLFALLKKREIFIKNRNHNYIKKKSFYRKWKS